MGLCDEGKAYVKCERITTACLFILKSHRMSKAMGDAYINLLYKYVIPCEYYTGYISPKTWEELLDVSISVCNSNVSALDNFTKLRLVWLLVRNGSSSCQLINPLRDSLPRLQKLFLVPTTDKKVQEVIIDILLHLLENLSSDYRLAMCKLTETIFGTMITFYNQNFDKRKSSLFKLFHMIVLLHHPQGRLQNEQGSLAYSWNKWNRHLNSVLELIYLEVKVLQKTTDSKFRVKDNITKDSEQLFSLAAAVLYQVFNMPPVQPVDDEAGSSSKRQKVAFNKNKTFADLIDELRQNHSLWLGITTTYIKNCGDKVSAGDSLSLLHILDNYVTSNNNGLHWGIFEELVGLTLRNLCAQTDSNIDESGGSKVLLSLWNSCVRHSTLSNLVHKAMHGVLQSLLMCQVINYKNVQPLVKLYQDKAMPVTDYSVKTLSLILSVFFTKYNDPTDKLKFFQWFMSTEITCTDMTGLQDLFLRLISNQNVDLQAVRKPTECDDTLHEILFNTVDKCILFSEFELDLPQPQPATSDSARKYEMHTQVKVQIQNVLEATLIEQRENAKVCETKLVEYSKHVRLVLNYSDMLVKYTNQDLDKIKKSKLYNLMKASLRYLLASLTALLNKGNESSDQTELLLNVQAILSASYNRGLSTDVRAVIEQDFFICVHNVINRVVKKEEDDDTDVDSYLADMRRNCICLLAAYCKESVNYREEILDLILDHKLYNFQYYGDIECAFQCMKTLIDAAAETCPIERIFGLMQNMCKDLFRNTKAIGGFLKILLTMLDTLWSHASSTMRGNCLIMVTGLLQRCEKQYYPPHVTALIYECVARIEALNRDQAQRSFKESLLAATKCDMHSVRLYCCYLMKYIAVDYESSNIDTHLAGIFEFFLIDVSNKTEQMLSDELANRTLTVLHEFVALAQTKSTLTGNVVAAVLKVQKEKSLDKNLVKKVLDKIANLISLKGIDEYLNRNVLSLSHSWFSANYKLSDLPVYLLGLSGTAAFLKAHLKWVVPAEILWAKDGKIENSEILLQITNDTNTNVEDVIESCFCTIIILCLPYVVVEKYNLHYRNQLKQLTYDQRAKNAETMFQLTRQVLGNEKWGMLYLETMGELVLLTALHLADCKDAKEVFGLDVPQPTDAFYYPTEVFNAVLQYYGELITQDIMKYLSENQPMVISKVILKLWEGVSQKTILEYKALSLSSYVKFIENVPMGYNSDHFVCNFSCSSLLHAAKSSTDKRELKLYIRTLDILLRRFLPEQCEILRETLPVVLSVLTIKKDEGFAAECTDLLEYLASSDRVDGVSVLSQTNSRLKCASMKEFKETLTNFLASLKCPSFEVLCNFKWTLIANKPLINKLCKELNLKGFSEDCKTSLLHQVINILNNILVSDSDNKTILEACDCLSTTGTYDLKTLVMLAPPDSRHVTDMRPSQYFATVVLKCLSQLLTDEQPALASKVMVTLARLLKYREGKIAFDLGEVNQQILRQFLPASNNSVQAKFQLNLAKFESFGLLDSWIPADSEEHGKWVVRLTTALLDIVASGDNYLSSLGIVCKSKPSLCRSILPALIGLVIHVSKEEHISIFTKQLNNLLNYFWEHTYLESGSCSADSPSRKTNQLGHEHKLIIQDLLNVVNFVRLQRSHYIKRHEENESLNYLRLEYDKVAWAAAISDNSLAALYYGELCASAHNGGVPPCEPELTAQLPAGEQIQSIFRKCFTSIGELDAIDGCGSGHLTSEQEKRRHLMNTRQYSDALLEHDIALSSDSDACSDVSLHGGVVRSLHKSGMHHLALQYIKSLPENDKLDDVKYECLSFLGDWSVFVDTNETENKLKSPNVDIHSVLKEFRYACLKDCLTTAASSHGFDEKLLIPLSKAKLAVSKLCQKLNMDNCQSVYTTVSQLQMFSDIEEYFSVRSGKLPLSELLDRWQLGSLAPFQDFRHVEALISQRSLILEHAAKQNCSSLKDIVKLQLNYAELGLSNQRIPLSQRLLAMAKKCQMTGELSMVEGQISWAKGHKDISLSLIRNVMYDDTADVDLTAAALRQYGLWMAESKCESARDIIDKYLKRSLEVVGGGDRAGIRLKLYYDIAKFADAEYKQVVAYMKSPIFENKVKCMENMKDSASQALRSTQNKALTRDEIQELKKAIVTNEKMSHLDEAEITSTMAEKKRFLDLAMRYYLLSLINCEANNLSVFRVISLWLDNPSFRFEECAPSFEELLLAVPARKYVPVLPQLAPRLSGGDDAFNCNLKMLLKKCATEHPHHTLPILFSLTNSDKDLRILNAAGRVRGGAAAVAGREEPRAAAAGRLLQELAGQGAAAGRRVDQMERLCDAIISFANYTSKTKDSRQEVPKSEPIRKLSNLDEIPIPTITLPIRHDCDYTYFPAIVSFADSFELVGGLHCPKKMTCKGSDGKQRTLLIKGEDDLRQDAVMQQVFTIVNTLLELNPVTSRKKLLIRTYKVVPLSRRSGVLEWCEGTTPIGTYLAGGAGGRGGGAHARYRPMDISCNAARAKLSTLHKEGRTKAEKLRAFQKILREFKPVFHYFFTEHYLDPATWYERRLAYTKSVATSSMVGYIMGLGDRHVQNILIDKNTAEVVHIDFGIAFDQGSVLPTPETVPFRLTQDIVAGFGCCGVEGVFRRCCEKSMQLLRDNDEVLLTILEVLLCDPLYSWTITQAEANRKQNITAAADTTLIAQNGGGSSGGLASRTLLAVGSKLSGTAGGAAGGVAVAGQVARLLRAAADPTNLSVLFPGWQPYL